MVDEIEKQNMGKWFNTSERFFRSIGILLSITSSNTYSLDLVFLKTWVKDYDEWYKKRVGIYQNKNLHLLYARNIHFFINGGLHLYNPVFCDLMRSVKSLGFVLNIHIDLIEFIEQKKIIKRMLSEVTNISWIINWSDCVELSDKKIKCVNELLEKIVMSNTSFVITGKYKFWKNTNIFSNRIINSTLYRFRPNIEKYKPNIMNEIVQKTPCASKFRMFVDSNGTLYPCYGLIGIPQYSLGNIADSIWNNKLNDEYMRYILNSWAIRGPELKKTKHVNIQSRLPYICALHRAEEVSA